MNPFSTSPFNTGNPIGGMKIPQSAADQHAAANWAANLRALAGDWGGLVQSISGLAAHVSWVYGRDGALTARELDGRWASGCSLPRRAGMAMLRKMNSQGQLVCFVAPAHAAQIAVALERLQPTQALLVIQGDLSVLRIQLACHDFSADIANQRLFFAWGDQWQARMEELFAKFPGLPTPTQFLRTITTPQETATSLMQASEKIFSAVCARRSEEIGRLIASWSPAAASPPAICLVVPGHYRIWDGASAALAGALDHPAAGASVSCVRFDPDRPVQSSALGLVRAAISCRGLVLADSGRCDMPPVLPPNLPVITWLTTGRIPAYNPAHPRDALLLADASWTPMALAMGWPADRTRHANWPAYPSLPASPAKGPIALIADTVSLQTPRKELELSSHHLLWDMVRQELHDNPMALGHDLRSYLLTRMAQLQIAEDGFDWVRFIDRLLVPAYQQGVARLLLAAKLPVRLYGRGWDALDEFKSAWAGAIASKFQFEQAVGSAAALACPWPTLHAHMIDSLGRPVLRLGRDPQSFIRNARQLLLAHRNPSRQTAAKPLCATDIVELLR